MNIFLITVDDSKISTSKFEFFFFFNCKICCKCISNFKFISFVVFFRYGGIYLDSDIIVVKPLFSLNNAVGLEDQLAGNSLNGAVMAFRKHRYLSWS